MSDDMPNLERSAQDAYKWLNEAKQILEKSPGNPVASRMLDNAAARYYRAVDAANKSRDKKASEAAAQNAEWLSSTDTPGDMKDFLVMSAIVVAVSIISGAAAGAAGAVLVKEILSKEVIKGMIGGFITSTATLVTEHVLSPPSRRTLMKLPPKVTAEPSPKLSQTLVDEVLEEQRSLGSGPDKYPTPDILPDTDNPRYP